ncbi:GNAT family N-acetyltransferase [Rhodococcoides fascians]|uniref:GNAT family N-acetyltransferase n=1 Tax=Rhodococcoides fascians TaxID=1828 RepID=UPI0024B9825B|nr:GNAT family N-acetyltransferase [Rhodococcus fascians]MDJ0409412.1 GNAT family N-acetyltransferase [Rhodococcus fascians]
MKIRSRRSGDMAFCVTALATVHEADGYPALWPEDPAAWLHSATQVAAWVAESNDRIVGHLALDLVDDGLVVSRLFVRPECRGTGAAAALLDAAVAYAAERTVAIELHVEQGSAAAIAFYEKSGWVRTGTAPADWVLPDGRRAVEHRYVPGR